MMKKLMLVMLSLLLALGLTACGSKPEPKPEDNKSAVQKIIEEAQGLTLEEMGKVLRLPRSTINYRLKKAKTILKQELEDWYDEDE